MTIKQRRFLGGVAVMIPQLIEAINKGTTMASYKLGTKRLEDGQRVELELVARVPGRKWEGVVKSWGQTPQRSLTDEEG